MKNRVTYLALILGMLSLPAAHADDFARETDYHLNVAAQSGADFQVQIESHSDKTLDCSGVARVKRVRMEMIFMFPEVVDQGTEDVPFEFKNIKPGESPVQTLYVDSEYGYASQNKHNDILNYHCVEIAD